MSLNKQGLGLNMDSFENFHPHVMLTPHVGTEILRDQESLPTGERKMATVGVDGTLWGIQKAKKYGMFRATIPAHWSFMFATGLATVGAWYKWREKGEASQQGAKLMASEAFHFLSERRIPPGLCIKGCTQPSMEAGIFYFLSLARRVATTSTYQLVHLWLILCY